MKMELVYNVLRFHDTCNYCYFLFSKTLSQLDSEPDEVLIETVYNTLIGLNIHQTWPSASI